MPRSAPWRNHAAEPVPRPCRGGAAAAGRAFCDFGPSGAEACRVCPGMSLGVARVCPGSRLGATRVLVTVLAAAALPRLTGAAALFARGTWRDRGARLAQRRGGRRVDARGVRKQRVSHPFAVRVPVGLY
jgi:hypothetical protein